MMGGLRPLPCVVTLSIVILSVLSSVHMPRHAALGPGSSSSTTARSVATPCSVFDAVDDGLRGSNGRTLPRLSSLDFSLMVLCTSSERNRHVGCSAPCTLKTLDGLIVNCARPRVFLGFSSCSAGFVEVPRAGARAPSAGLIARDQIACVAQGPVKSRESWHDRVTCRHWHRIFKCDISQRGRPIRAPEP